jgi:hypothetical protein
MTFLLRQISDNFFSWLIRNNEHRCDPP